MTRIFFLNGAFVAQNEARVSVMDRGFLFADGIYEVSAVLGGRLIDNEAHLGRLDRSLQEIRLENPYGTQQWIAIQTELIRRNAFEEGLVYWQVTRGVAERDFAFPKATKPTVVMFTQGKNILSPPQAETGIDIVTLPDWRWKRRDIKSIALLAQVLAKQAAVEANAAEAWMIEDGFITEGSASTAFIVTGEGHVVTRPLSTAILPGITRRAVLKLTAEQGLVYEERPFTLQEAFASSEAFLTSASSFVMPVVRIDGRAIGTGRPGPMTKRLRSLYLEMAMA